MKLKIYLYTIQLTILFLGFSHLNASDWKSYFDSIKVKLENSEFSNLNFIEVSNKLFDYLSSEKNIIPDSNYTEMHDKMLKTMMETTNYDIALKYARLDSEIQFNNYGDKSEQFINSLCELAHIYDYLLMKGNSFSLFNEAISKSISAFGSASPIYARTLYKSSFYFNKYGHYVQSEDMLKTSMSIFLNHFGKKNHEYLEAINELALIYSLHGRYYESEKLYLELLKAMQDSLGFDNWDYVFQYETQLANLYSEMGRYDEKEKIDLHFLKVAEERSNCNIKSVDSYTPLNNLTNVYMSLGKYNEALIFCQRTLDLLQKHNYGDMASISRIYNRMAIIFNILGDYKLSEFMFDLTMDIRNNPIYGCTKFSISSSLLGLSVLYMNIGRFNDAEKNLKQALETIEDFSGKNNSYYYNGIKILAFLYEYMGKYKDSEKLYKQVINFNVDKIHNSFSALTEKEKNQLIGTFREVFERFYFLGLINSNKNPSILSDIYNYQIETKGIILSTSKNSREKLFRSKDTSLIEEYNTWTGLKNNLIELKNKSEENPEKYQDEIKKLEIDVYDKEKALSRKSADFTKEYLKKSTTWKDVQSKLKSNEAAVEIIRLRQFGMVPNKYKHDVLIHGFTDTVYYAALVITKKTKKYPELILLKNGNDLEYGFIIQYNRAIKFEYDDKDSYDAYWSEIRKKLKGIKKVYVSPDGVYNQLNISSIYNPYTKKYIADEINIINITNGKDIIEASESRNKNADSNNVDIFGDIIFEKKLPQLPGTRIEADKISELMTGNGYAVKEFLGEKATKFALKSVINPEILHISTHTYFKDHLHKQDSNLSKEYSLANDPMLNSGLFMSRDNTHQQDSNSGNNIMTAYEAASLNLEQTECVVLSACQTGLGEVMVGEGIYGLQRAIKLAGAKSIIMSLWKVNDKTTQELMVKYYKKYLIYHNKHRAFDEAQRELRKKYPQPYYWGAFILVGG